MNESRARRWANQQRRRCVACALIAGSAAALGIEAYITAPASGVYGRSAARTPTATAAAVTPTVWTHVASACTPDESSTGRYNTHTSGLKHRGSAIGQLVTRCNVGTIRRENDGNQSARVYMYVVYRDQDDESSGQRALVRLIRSNRDGTTKTVGTFDSNRVHHLIDPNGATVRAYTSTNVREAAFSTAVYYVDIRLYRETSTISPIVTSVELTTLLPLISDPSSG